MIAVLADDLSGAAELAGLAYRHGLNAEVQTVFNPATDADVVCLDTATRLLTVDEAVRRVTAATAAIQPARPSWVFKKCDSVLRGHVLAEARAVAAAAGLRRVCLIPANPSRGRTLENGRYLIAGRPLDQTPFAHDPHHPRRSAHVTDLLGNLADDVRVPGIATIEDVQREARSMDAATLPAGAADFFRELLSIRVPARPRTSKHPIPVTTGRTLAVCGSAVAWPQRAQEAARHAIAAAALPHDHDALAQALTAGSLLLGIGGSGPALAGKPSSELTDALIDTALALTRAARPDQLLLEGGDTAAAFLRAAGWTQLRVTDTCSGVATLEPVGAASVPRLHIKPGSYAWPADLWPPRPA